MIIPICPFAFSTPCSYGCLAFFFGSQRPSGFSCLQSQLDITFGHHGCWFYALYKFHQYHLLKSIETLNISLQLKIKFLIMSLILIEVLNLVHAVSQSSLPVYLMTPAILISSFVIFYMLGFLKFHCQNNTTLQIRIDIRLDSDALRTLSWMAKQFNALDLLVPVVSSLNTHSQN
jgi:hypothetical protein